MMVVGNLDTLMQARMQSYKATTMTAERRRDGTLRWHATFETHEDALTWKQEGHGGWVLGTYWYDCSHTPSEVMRLCPASGTLR